MKSAEDAAAEKTISPNRGWAVGEVVLVFLLFFIFAAWSAPDVNEAHYLAKAKHYWNPDWCAGDHFLESADAHEVFYWTFGWVTLLFPLPVVAWIGRILTWGLLAWAWRRLSFAVAPYRLAAVLSAGLFLSLMQCCQMAGEWVIGGVEAKGFAYVFMLLGVESLVRNRWRRAWLLLGVASAFHVLVGGWSVIAAGFAWLIAGKRRPSLASMLPALASGLLLSLPGLLPGLSLTWGVSPDIVREANEIYVIERLSHHLLFFKFEPRFVAFFVAMLIQWLVLWWVTRGGDDRRRLNGFVAGAVVIAIVGLTIDFATIGNTALTAKVMRYYWYRLADAVVPIGAALGLTVAILQLRRWRPVVAQWCLVGAIVLVGLNVGRVVYRQQVDPRPLADQQSLPSYEADRQWTWETYEDWRRVCGWIATHTQPTDRFLTPRAQQTFKWYAGRSEVATWKDIPQDAKGVVQWWKRLQDVYFRRDGRPIMLAHRHESELVRLARKYDARFIVIDRTQGMRGNHLVKVYPNFDERNVSYEVYLVPSQK